MAPPAPLGSAVSGALGIGGNEPAPAIRVCAQAVDAGSTRCIHSPAGAGSYRIDGLVPGRYHLLGWIHEGEVRLVAHARAIRCIRAPCPADTLIAVDVPAGAELTGIDLGVAYLEPPAGWPREPQ